MITPFLLYILKLNIAIAVFYLFYHFILRKETFYACNRAYFIMVLGLAALFPLFDLSIFFPSAQPLILLQGVTADIDMELTGGKQPMLASDYITIAVIVGAAVLLLRLIIQIASLLRLYFTSEKTRLWNKNIVAINDNVNPFSFFGYIFINLQLHDNEDIHEIIAHEDVHAKQYHTIDILLYEITVALCWYNPFIWMMRKSVKQNIEFLADRQTLKAGYNKKHYQYNLLKVSRIPVLSGIVNNFNFNDLKNRIAMMNKKQSPNSNLLKYLFIIPTFIAATLILNAQNIITDNKTGKTESGLQIPNPNTQFYNNLQKTGIVLFDKEVYDFGTILESNGETSAIFTFINKSNQPLIISNVSASCGCTVPEWTKNPVPPGGKGIIKATYDPVGRVAPFNRSLTVSYNVEPYHTQLHIKGTVIK